MREVKIYEKRVEVLLGMFNKENLSWTQKRTWLKDMLEFKLGSDFFVKFFIEKDDKLTQFQDRVITIWADEIVNSKNPQSDDERFEITDSVMRTSYLIGTEIDPNYLTGQTEEVFFQQKCLDYAWWISMKNILYPTASTMFQRKLDKKDEELLQMLN